VKDKNVGVLVTTYVQCLEDVKNNSKNVPAAVDQHIDQLLKKVAPSKSGLSISNNTTHITVIKVLYITVHTVLLTFNSLFLGQGQLLPRTYQNWLSVFFFHYHISNNNMYNIIGK
jgi:hypothetical protein